MTVAVYYNNILAGYSNFLLPIAITLLLVSYHSSCHNNFIDVPSPPQLANEQSIGILIL